MVKVAEGDRINFRVRPDIHEVLRRVMYETRISQQELVEKALESYFKDELTK